MILLDIFSSFHFHINLDLVVHYKVYLYCLKLNYLIS